MSLEATSRWAEDGRVFLRVCGCVVAGLGVHEVRLWVVEEVKSLF